MTLEQQKEVRREVNAIRKKSDATIKKLNKTIDVLSSRLRNAGIEIAELRRKLLDK